MDGSIAAARGNDWSRQLGLMDPKTVLVVHPDPVTHRKVDQALVQTGFLVLHNRGSEGLDEVLVDQQVHVVLSAITLDGSNGYDLSRELRDRFPAALILLLAGGFEVYNVERAGACGVDGRLGVPFTPISLRAILEEKLGPLPRQAGGESETSAEVSGRFEANFEGGRTQPVGQGLGGGRPTPPISEERLASFLPRDHRPAKVVTVDPLVVGPALERAVLDVLPEVVEGALRTALSSSPEFRQMVAEAVSEVLATRLPEIADRVLAQQDDDR